MNADTLSHNIISDALHGFFESMFRSERISNGYLFTSTVCMPDGWQIAFELTQATPTSFRLSDRGYVASWLTGLGQNIESDLLKLRITNILQECKAEQEGSEIVKLIKAPLDGRDIHVFSEALQGVASLHVLNEHRITLEPVENQIVEKVFHDANIGFKKKHKFNLSRDRKVSVDYYAENESNVAIKIIKSKTDFTGSIEKWATRWQAITKANTGVIPVMLYDRNRQNLDRYTERIANESCKIFCGYDETDKILEVISG